MHTLARSWTRQHHAKAARSAPLLVFEISLICMKGSVVTHYVIEWNDLIGFPFDHTDGECLALRLLEIICETAHGNAQKIITGFKNMLLGFDIWDYASLNSSPPPPPPPQTWGGGSSLSLPLPP